MTPVSKSRMNFFCIPDLGFRFPDPTYELSHNFFDVLLLFQYCEIYGYKKDNLFFPLFFCVVVGSGMKKSGSGTSNPDPQHCISVNRFYPFAYMTDVQATGEVSSPRKRTSRIQNNTFLYFFLVYRFFFAHLNPDPADQTKCINADPDTQHRYKSWQARVLPEKY